MKIGPNLEDMSEEETHNLVLKLLNNLDNKLLQFTKDRKRSIKNMKSEGTEDAMDSFNYYQSQNRLIEFYKKYGANYFSQLN